VLFDLNPKKSPRELFGRENELDELIRLIKARRWVALLGPRMVGKTSIVKVANTRLGHV
jgi:AAA+ ATPase superfamily predicted ATPase